MRALLAVLLLLTFVLAGCASKGGAGDDDDTGTSTASGSSSGPGTQTRTGSGSTSGTSSGAPGPNHAPSALLSAAINGTTVAFNMTGADADGDALSWNLTFGDGQASQGAALPANATHTYAAPGLFNASLSVTDGKDVTIVNVSINATAAGAGAAQDASGETVGSVAGCGPGIAGLVGAGQDYAGGAAEGVEWVKFDVVAGTIGKPFTWDEDPTSPAIMGSFMAFYKADDSFLAEDFSGAGTVPADSGFAVFYACGPGPDAFTYHAG